jgi:hypothetical protein
VSDEIRVVPNGLVTDPSAILAGDGGLVRAQNVLCKRPGLIEPRGGFHVTVAHADVRSFYTTYAREWNGFTWLSMTDATQSKICHGTGAPVRTIAGPNYSLRAEQYNDQQMWTFEKLIRCIDHSNDEANCFKRPPGSPRSMGMVCFLSGLGTWFASGYCTAYKSVIVRHVDTSNGSGTSERLLIGAPSEAQVIRNNTAGANGIRIEVALPPNIQVGDEVQIYRSPVAVPNPAEPSDVFALRYSRLVDAADIAVGYVNLNDVVADGDWNGPSLYTMLAEQGPARANYRIRIATDLAYYNGMMFYAGAKRSQTIDVAIKSIGPISAGSGTFSETLLSVRTDSVNWTNGSPTITGVAATIFQYLAVGQVVTRDLANVNPSTGAGSTGIYGRILSFNSGAGTITLDTNATATAAGTLICWDWFGISDGTTTSAVFAPWVDPVGGTTFDLSAYVDPVFARYATPIFATAPPILGAPAFYAAGAGDIERAWAYGYAASVDGRFPRIYVSAGSDRTKNVSCLFEYDVVQDATGNADIATAPQFGLVSTKPNAFSAPCALTFALTKVKSSFDGNIARLAWSKSFEPEAVPLGYFSDIGDTSEPIARIFSTTDSLWVLKADGLWRVYGDGPESLVIQPVDPTVRAVINLTASDPVDCSSWAAKVGNTIYAWTRRGIVSISSAGVQRIDGPIATEIKQFTPGGSLDLELQPVAPWCSASVRDSLVAFGCLSHQFADGVGLCYVYHTESETWSTWSADLGGYLLPQEMCGSGNSEDGTFRIGMHGGYLEYVDAPIYDGTSYTDDPPLERADRFINLPDELFEITVVSDRTATYIDSTAPSLVGAMFADSDDNLFTVLDDDGSRLTLDKDGCQLGVVTAIWWPQPIEFTFSGTTEGLPSVEKYFDETCTSFQALRGGTGYSVAHKLRGQVADSAVGLDVVYDSPDDAAYPQYLLEQRQYVRTISSPVQQGRGTGMEVTLGFLQARRYFSLDGFVIKLRPATYRQPGRR